jgi:hypothetical protein
MSIQEDSRLITRRAKGRCSHLFVFSLVLGNNILQMAPVLKVERDGERFQDHKRRRIRSKGHHPLEGEQPFYKPHNQYEDGPTPEDLDVAETVPAVEYPENSHVRGD